MEDDFTLSTGSSQRGTKACRKTPGNRERIQMLRKSSRRPFEEYKEYAKRMEADVLLYLETGEKLSAVEIV